MKSCKGCIFADWQFTKGGKLHPSGDGRCRKLIVVPRLPAAFYWVSAPPTPYGGYINRKKDNNDHCAYWQSGQYVPPIRTHHGESE